MKHPERRLATFTAAIEKPVLIALAKRMPASVTPDRLTLFGVAGAALTGLAFALSPRSDLWFLVAVAGLVVNWYGDSLDGTLARLRGIERPVYGSFIDTCADMLSAALIIVGMGLSAHVRLDVALAVLATYYAIAVVAHARTQATGVYIVGEGGVGPTEARMGLALLALSMMVVPAGTAIWSPAELSAYDILFIVAVAIAWPAGIVAALATARGVERAERQARDLNR
jgi:archaetidylinositol phosphate synthase